MALIMVGDVSKEFRWKNDEHNKNQQNPPRKQNVARAYSAGSSEKKEYAGTLPLCNKCKFHHNGSCTVKCATARGQSYCLRLSESAATKQSRTSTAKMWNQEALTRLVIVRNLKNWNHGNHARGTKACGMVSRS
ncbi:hypothetical protein Tco_0891146 [Tanacetum coccineum]|uniref:Uncharacterized protein n=1 Tax=Tanacetum coccineum TaxID=301880 RepID=A0ABQ5C7L0_9ASTR